MTTNGGAGVDGSAVPEPIEDLLGLLAGALSDPEPDAAVDGICELARRLCAADCAFYVPADQSLGQPVMGWTGRFTTPPEPYQAPLLVAAQAAEEPLRVDDVILWAHSEDAQRPYGTTLEGRLPRSWLGVPVRAPSGDRYGSLLLCSALVRAFGDEVEERAVRLAACLAAVLQNQRLSQERASVVQALERTLLPPLLPAVEGLEMAARYRATGAGNVVGGDFYDVFPTGEDWDVLLGDVSGFGPEAAAVTGIARYTVRAVAGQADGPATVLRLLNDAMVGRVPDDRFCTAVFLRLRREGSDVVVRLANGGHPPPFLLRDDGKVESRDEAGGMLLGVVRGASVSEAELRLEPGDALVLYTDGVTEARSPAGDLFGSYRLEDLLATCAGRTADGVARRVELAVVDHQGGVTRDDLAVLVLRVPKSAAPGLGALVPVEE